MKLRTVRDLEVDGKTVLLRVDYNVPIEDGKVDDDLRLKASFETIRYLLERGCKIVLISHLGRPEGKVDPKFSLKPVAKRAAELLDHPIKFMDDCVGEKVKAQVSRLKAQEIVLLENLRFHPEEEDSDVNFAKQLADLAEVYVNDAFAVVHHGAASLVQVTEHLPSAAGFLIEREVKFITDALNHPTRPVLAIIGGAKIDSKIDVLNNLIPKVEHLLIGGAMANTFLAAEGHNVGKSLYEEDELEVAREIMRHAHKLEVNLILPNDVVVASKVEDDAKTRTVFVAEVEPDDIIVDLGPRAIETALATIKEGGTVIWNGPVGITEIEAFSIASRKLAEGIIASGATSIVGGGDTADFVDGAGLHDKFSFVSTGGGASLELMSGKKLPGLEVLIAE